MIKTVSFAPPRAASGASSKPSSKVAARSAGVQKAKARATSGSGASQASVMPPTPLPASVQAAPVAAPLPAGVPASSLTSLFPLPPVPAPISAAQVREQLSNGAPATKSRSRGTSTTSDVPSAPAKRASRKSAPVAPSLDLFSVEDAPAPFVERSEAAVEAPAPKAVAPKRLKRAKVPVNLAEQYGQSLSRRVESGVASAPVEEESPKKRLNRAERAARRELMAPDDELRARLHRAQNAVPSAKPQKRPRGWRFDCGRCGQTSYFETPGALCSCGALAIKE